MTTYITPFQNELEIKDTTDTQKSASYLDLHLEIDNEAILKLNSTTNMMTSDFRVNFPFIRSNLLAPGAWSLHFTTRRPFKGLCPEQ